MTPTYTADPLLPLHHQTSLLHLFFLKIFPFSLVSDHSTSTYVLSQFFLHLMVCTELHSFLTFSPLFSYPLPPFPMAFLICRECIPSQEKCPKMFSVDDELCTICAKEILLLFSALGKIYFPRFSLAGPIFPSKHTNMVRYSAASTLNGIFTSLGGVAMTIHMAIRFRFQFCPIFTISRLMEHNRRSNLTPALAMRPI